MQEHQTLFSVKEIKNKIKNAFVGGIPNREHKIQIIENWQNRIKKEKTITKEFYDFYHSLRELFFYHLKTHNSHIEPLQLLEYAQTIMNRVVLLCVIKDYNLVPYKVLKEIEKLSTQSWESDKFELWRQLIKFFHALDAGLPNRIQKFNGGLFRQNPEIDDLKINSIFLKKLLSIGNYDFESDLNVNVLGHIFEQSITDIEQFKQSIAENKQVEYLETDDEIALKLPHSQTNKRKKDGIFYTPENITQYIVKSTVGIWLDEKKTELGLFDNESIEKWEQYKDVLKSIKILDPACGSGAFLTQTFDFLLREWLMVVDSIEKLKGESIEFRESGLFSTAPTKNQESIAQIKKEIVSNNLYGVDLNKESVEITKLGLWLKSASKNDPLALLDRNIKCGNSLISDKNITDKAFVWEEGFMNLYNPDKYYELTVPEYHEKIRLAKIKLEDLTEYLNNHEPYVDTDKIRMRVNGKRLQIEGFEYELQMLHLWKSKNPQPFSGFDIIVGNPPYVSTKGIDEVEKTYFIENYKTAVGQFDLYGLFIEKCIQLLHKNSKFGFITSNTYLSNKDFLELRKILLENTRINEITNLGETVFTDANLDVCILLFSLAYNENNSIKIILNDENFRNDIFHFIAQKRFYSEENNYEIKLNSEEEDFILIDKIFENKPELSTILNLPRGIEIGSNSEKIFTEPQHDTHKLLVGKDISKYAIHFADRYIKFEIDKSVFKELEIYQQPKILIQRIRNLSLKTRIVATIDEHNHLCTNTLRIGILKNKDFDLKYILAVLNSKLINWIFTKYFLNKDIYAYQLERLPIPIIPISEQEKLVVLVDKLLEINKEVEQQKSKFVNRMVSNFKLGKASKVVSNYSSSSFEELVDELKKHKIDLSLKKQDELEEYFNESKNQVVSQIQQSKLIDSQIDTLVYGLYHLSAEEIAWIEK